MSKGRDRNIYKRKDGKWVNKRQDAEKASSLHKTQEKAEKVAKIMLRNQGGGEIITSGRDGKFNSKDTIKPGKDPCPPKDTEY